jgi:hypothetical protein
LRAALDSLKPGDTLVIYKPDRVARSMKELLVLLEDGTVNLLKLSGGTGMVGSGELVCGARVRLLWPCR